MLRSDSSAFSYCWGLSTIAIPNSVIVIGRGAFSGSGLISIDLGLGVETIGPSALSYCEGLSTIKFSSTLMSLGGFVMEGCVRLESICSQAVNPPSAGASTFLNVDTMIPLYVPAVSVSLYQSASEWKVFTVAEKVITGLRPVELANSVNIFPNPTATTLTIDLGTSIKLNGHELIVLIL